MDNAIAEVAKINGDTVKVIKVEEAAIDDVVNSDVIAFGCPATVAEVLEEEFMELFIQDALHRASCLIFLILYLKISQ